MVNLIGTKPTALYKCNSNQHIPLDKDGWEMSFDNDDVEIINNNVIISFPDEAYCTMEGSDKIAHTVTGTKWSIPKDTCDIIYS